MAAPKYDNRRHRQLRAKLKLVVQAGQGWCAETICMEEQDGRTRWIQPGTAWDVAHTDDATNYKGPAHQRCNRADAARRGNKMRAKSANANGFNRKRRVL